MSELHETARFRETYEKMFPFWEELPKEEQQYLCANSAEVHFSKGTTLHDGTECSGVFLVRRGCLRVYVMSEEGKAVTLYRLHEGEMCMLSASCVLQAITFDVLVDAEEDSECCVVSGHAFAAVTEQVPAAKIFALELAVTRFSDVMWVMQQILFMSMDRRLAIFLLDESARLGSTALPLTHEQIARYMGSAREVVSRMLKYFAAEGLVEVSRKELRLLDKERLRKLAF